MKSMLRWLKRQSRVKKKKFRILNQFLKLVFSLGKRKKRKNNVNAFTLTFNLSLF
jgi:hypothetical protein